MEQSSNTQVTCSSCGQLTTVPFVPTPGRPVYCRECFSKQRAASEGSGGRGGGGGGFRPQRFGGGGGGDGGGYSRGPPASNARKRMLAQGRKGHFMYDAREVMQRSQGGMDDQHHRAFLEGLFARGARGSTEDAQVFLDEKLTEGKITKEERDGLGRLLERYSFWR